MLRQVIAFTLLSQGCVTASTKEFKESRVIEKIANKSETPAWADGSIAMAEESSDVIFVSQVSMGANSRTEACLKAAELDGRSSMARYIKEHISTSGQVNERDAASDPGYEALTAFLSQSKLSGVKTTQRYWEKVEQSDESGERVLKLRCVAKLAVNKAELQRQLREATTANGGNAQIRASLLNAQSSFFEGLAHENEQGAR